MANDTKQHEAAVDAYLAKLRGFLMTPDHSDTAWPTIPAGDMATLDGLVRDLLLLKWSQDCDGDMPVKFRAWNRRTHLLAWDVPVRQGEEGESDDAYSQRLLANLRTVSGALSTYSRMVEQLHNELDALRRHKACAAAAFPVFLARYRDINPEPAFSNDTPASLHVTLEALEAFVPPPGFVRVKVSQRWAVPGLYEDSAENFAAYRATVVAQCGQLRPLHRELEKLGLSASNPCAES